MEILSVEIFFRGDSANEDFGNGNLGDMAGAGESGL